MAIVSVIIALFISIIVIGGVCLFQIVLSKTESKFPGLILPIISFGFSLIMLVGVISFYSYETTSYTTESSEIESSEAFIEESEEEDSEEIVEMEEGVSIFESEEEAESAVAGNPLLTSILLFVLFNIPTVILILIYIATRKRVDKNRQIDQTRIQDL